MFEDLSRQINEFGSSVLNALGAVQDWIGGDLKLVNPIRTSVFKLVGNSPLIELNVLGEAYKPHKIYLKAEFLNPTGSIKDRTAISILQYEMDRGALKKNMQLELFGFGTGNLALVWAARRFGFEVVVYLEEKTNPAHVTKLRQYGATVKHLAELEFQKSFLEKQKSPKTQSSLYLSEDTHLANPNSHFFSTGPEIFRDLAGNVDVLVCGGGSGGSLSGAGRFLKKQKPGLQCVMAATPDSQFLTKSGQLPLVFDPKIVDVYIPVTKDEGRRTQAMLYEKEGIFAGFTTGLTLMGALKFAESLEGKEPKNIVVISPDRE